MLYYIQYNTKTRKRYCIWILLGHSRSEDHIAEFDYFTVQLVLLSELDFVIFTVELYVATRIKILENDCVLIILNNQQISLSTLEMALLKIGKRIDFVMKV